MTCVVCGADIKKSRHGRQEPWSEKTGVNTCDPVCTRAKHAGRTREEQYWEDEKERIHMEDTY